MKAGATPREQAYIDALAERYSGDAADRPARDRAYAAAMKRVVERFPDDLDAAALYAESVMDLRPWGYWMPDGTPYEGTAEIVALLESVIRRDPNHPGALHLYIHLLESTKDAARAIPAADRLLTLMPAAGHMVHMPGHIYQRVGRYGDAVRANELAILADEDYITQCRAQGLYPMGYYPHNVHFLWWSATMDGRATMAIDAARKVAAKIPDAMLKEMPMLAGFRVIPAYRADEVRPMGRGAAGSPRPRRHPLLRGHLALCAGLAFLGKGQALDAEGELVAVRKALSSPDLDAPLFSPNTMRAVLAIAPEVLAGEIAAARRDYAAAVAHLERAVRLDDGLVYTEPAEWHYPPRHALGAVLLEAGRPAEAETVYWEDLRRNPENGWALTGLLQALKTLGRTQRRGSHRREARCRLAPGRPAAQRVPHLRHDAHRERSPSADDASARPFDTLTPVQPPAAAGSMAPQLAASSDGRVFLSWLEPAAQGATRFRLAQWSAGAWDSRADIVRGTNLFANWADVPSVFAAGDGRLLAHWLEKTGAPAHAYGIRVSESEDHGRTWSPPITPHRDASLTEHGFLSFFDTPDGAVGMVWLDGRQTAAGPAERSKAPAQPWSWRRGWRDDAPVDSPAARRGAGSGRARRRARVRLLSDGRSPHEPRCHRGLPRPIGRRGPRHQHRQARGRQLAARRDGASRRVGRSTDVRSMARRWRRWATAWRWRGSPPPETRAGSPWRSPRTAAPRSASRFGSMAAEHWAAWMSNCCRTGARSSCGSHSPRGRRNSWPGASSPMAGAARLRSSLASAQTVRAVMPV